MAVYLGLVGDSLYPPPLGPEENGGVCGICHERPAAWGDWMCSRCRAEFEAQLRVKMGGEDEEGNDLEEWI